MELVSCRANVRQTAIGHLRCALVERDRMRTNGLLRRMHHMLGRPRGQAEPSDAAGGTGGYDAVWHGGGGSAARLPGATIRDDSPRTACRRDELRSHRRRRWRVLPAASCASWRATSTAGTTPCRSRYRCRPRALRATMRAFLCSSARCSCSLFCVSVCRSDTQAMWVSVLCL